MMVNEDHNHSDTELSHEAKELVLHGDNNTHLYHSSTVPIRKNLNKKIKKGVYDHEKAKKLWGYHADRAAQSYTKEHGHAGQKWHELFTPKHRKAAAKHWADEHHEAVISGDTGHMHEDDSFATEIVFAAMGKKPLDVNDNFKEAILERSKELVDDMKSDLSGHFAEAFGTKDQKTGVAGGTSQDGANAVQKLHQLRDKKAAEAALVTLKQKRKEAGLKESEPFKLNPKKKGMWNGYSEKAIAKAKSTAKKDGNVTREREATFALNAKSGKI